MTIRNHLAAAALAAVVAALVIACLLIPSDRWTHATIASVAAFSIALGSLIYLPGAFAPAARSTASSLAGVGPVGLTTLLWFGLCVLAVIASLATFETLAWALLVLAVLVLVVGLLLSSVTRKTVDHVQATQQKDSRYRAWTVSLNQVAADLSDDTLKTCCTQLAEELRYMPSARATDAADEASRVAAAISALQASAARGDNADVTLKLTQLRQTLALHASALTALRSQA